MEDLCEKPPLTRDTLKVAALLSLTAAAVLACVLIVVPFLPAITWALALATVAYPLHGWMTAQIGRRDLAAAATVTLIVLALLAPAVFVASEIGTQVSGGLQRAQEMVKSGELKSQLKRSPAAPLVRTIESHIDVEKELRQLGEGLQQSVGGWISGTIWILVQLLLTIFLLFYLFRDHDKAIATLRSFLPLSDSEADFLLDRVRSMIRATMYGTVGVAGLQGMLGGLMFWILGVPGPLLWGAAMAILAVIPTLGTFVVWMPAAALLASQGSYVRAVILAVWGLVAVSGIDNLLYPMLVGKETRLHTVPVFLALIGGLLLFGAPGIVLGPLILTVTLALLEVLRRRTRGNRSAEQPV
jgi:predicted PurR-regulated permease PerM